MANAKPWARNPFGPIWFKHMTLISLLSLALIVLVGLLILAIWLTILPKKLVYTIDSGSIHNYSLSNGNHLDATYNFTLEAYNPNKRVSVYYEKAHVHVLYENKSVSRSDIDPFYQPKMNMTRFEFDLALHDVVLPDQIARDLEMKRSSGRVGLSVKFRATIRVKVGVWKSRHYKMRVLCPPIMVPFSTSSKGSESNTCDVDFYKF